jgi:hypothetical protein
VLIVRDDTRWSQELLRRLDHSKEAIHLARTHFVMAQVTEEALPPAARLQFNEVTSPPQSHLLHNPGPHMCMAACAVRTECVLHRTGRPCSA